jgi:hypothetical protein
MLLAVCSGVRQQTKGREDGIYHHTTVRTTVFFLKDVTGLIDDFRTAHTPSSRCT